MRREIARLEDFVRQLDAGSADLAHHGRRYADSLERAGGRSPAREADLARTEQALRLNRREKQMMAERLSQLRADLAALEHAGAMRSGE